MAVQPQQHFAYVEERRDPPLQEHQYSDLPEVVNISSLYPYGIEHNGTVYGVVPASPAEKQVRVEDGKQVQANEGKQVLGQEWEPSLVEHSRDAAGAGPETTVRDGAWCRKRKAFLVVAGFILAAAAATIGAVVGTVRGGGGGPLSSSSESPSSTPSLSPPPRLPPRGNHSWFPTFSDFIMGRDPEHFVLTQSFDNGSLFLTRRSATLAGGRASDSGLSSPQYLQVQYQPIPGSRLSLHVEDASPWLGSEHDVPKVVDVVYLHLPFQALVYEIAHARWLCSLEGCQRRVNTIITTGSTDPTSKGAVWRGERAISPNKPFTITKNGTQEGRSCPRCVDVLFSAANETGLDRVEQLLFNYTGDAEGMKEAGRVDGSAGNLALPPYIPLAFSTGYDRSGHWDRHGITIVNEHGWSLVSLPIRQSRDPGGLRDGPSPILDKGEALSTQVALSACYCRLNRQTSIFMAPFDGGSVRQVQWPDGLVYAPGVTDLTALSPVDKGKTGMVAACVDDTVVHITYWSGGRLVSASQRDGVWSLVQELGVY